MATIQQFREVHVNEGNTIIMPASTNFTELFDFGGTSPCAIGFDEFMENKTVTFQVFYNPPNHNLVYANYYQGGVLISIDVPSIPAGQDFVQQNSANLFAGVRYMRALASLEVVQDSKIVFFTRPV